MENLIQQVVKASDDAEQQLPSHISFLDVNGKSINLSMEESYAYLKGDFRAIEGDFEKAQEMMNEAEGMVQGILYSLVESLYSNKENKNASDKAILRKFDFAVALIEEKAKVSSKPSDAGLYSKTYASRKSPIRSNIRKVGNPFKIKLEGDEQLTSYAWLKRGVKSKEKNPLEKSHASQNSKVSKINAKRKKLGQSPVTDKELQVIADMNNPTDLFLEKEIKKLDKKLNALAKAEEVKEVAQSKTKK